MTLSPHTAARAPAGSQPSDDTVETNAEAPAADVAGKTIRIATEGALILLLTIPMLMAVLQGI